MPLLVRKITRSKWEDSSTIRLEDVQADSITNCMKTTRNTLSTWQIANEEELPEAILAIVAGQQHLETIDIVCLDRASLENKSIALVETEGSTPIKELRKLHVDIHDLTCSTLGVVGREIAEHIRENKENRYTKSALKALLKTAVSGGRLALEDLHESVRKELSK